MAEQELNSKKTNEKIFKERLNDLRANLIRAHDYKVFMTETINALEILGNEVFKEESEVEHAEALRSPEESSSADA